LSRIQDNFARVSETIEKAARRASRDPASIRLCVVTKKVGEREIREAVQAGARILGENRLQESVPKIEALSDLRAKLEWHLVGHLQQNKARRSVGLFDVIESVDSMTIAQRLASLGQERGDSVRVFVEVKTSNEPEKKGFLLDVAKDAIEETLALDGLRVEGLMTMAPFTDDAASIRSSFASLRNLRDRLPGGSALALSMGMTDDYEIAIEEGSTLVRIGTAIFA
jgi:pyridoxal phosphate enzyme (YggS family)